MMRRIGLRTFSLLAIAATFSGGLATAEGCGSDSFTAAPSTDGGGDEAATTAPDTGSPQDGGPPMTDVDACVKPPTVPAPETPFCDAFAEITTRCKDCDPCRQTNANGCQGYADSLSDALRSGVVACKDTIGCAALESQVGLAEDPCVTSWILDGGVTTTQIGAQVAYCNHCADGGSAITECETDYFGLPDGGNGAGGVTLVASDAVATTIANTCTGYCDPGLYALCTIGTFCNAAGKDTCSNSSALCH